MKNRDNKGRYDFENLNLICQCGHKLAVHAAKNDTNLRPCFSNDDCDCDNFIKQK